MRRPYDYLVPVCVFGESSVGKTALLYRFREDTFEDSVPTIGVEFSDKEIEVGSSVVKLQCWDTAGDTRFKSTVKQYFRQKAACVVVFDLTDRATFNAVAQWIDDLTAIAHPQATIILIGNKTDLPRKVPKIEVEEFAIKSGLKYFETSAKNGENVQKAFNYLAESVMLKLERGDIKIEDENIGIRKNGALISSDLISNDGFKQNDSKNDRSFLDTIWDMICKKKKR